MLESSSTGPPRVLANASRRFVYACTKLVSVLSHVVFGVVVAAVYTGSRDRLAQPEKSGALRTL